MHELDDLRAVGQGIIETAMVAVTSPSLAEISEVKAAVAVKDDVVRRRQFVTPALAVEDARLAGARIDPLNVAALVILSRPGREKPAFGIFVAAIVAQIERAIRAAGEPVWAAARRPDRGFAAVRRDAGNRVAGDLAQGHRAIGHRDGSLGKS